MEEEQELAMTDAIEGVASRVTHVAHEVGAVKAQGADLKKDVAEIQDELGSVHSLLEEVWNVLQKTGAKDTRARPAQYLPTRENGPRKGVFSFRKPANLAASPS
jgi:hypothetical protein